MAKMTLKELTNELTEQEIIELEAAEKMTHELDEDSPVMTMDQLMKFKRINHRNRTKPTVSLRISQNTLSKAKRFGKGYTGFLSRLLDLAIDDPELVRKCI
jgi:uncharacterized protein (DUF4415 family)